MSKISKYVKIHKDVLLEYTYNSGNLVTEPYDILVNSKDRKKSYMAGVTSATGNTQTNQLFLLDPVERKFGKINPDYYTFLQVKNYASSLPIRHDIINIHVPINWTFGEYLGFYLKVYTFDTQNANVIELSNFYFDMTDIDQQYLMNFTSPPLLFQEKLWGKSIKIEVPSASYIASQLTDNRPTENSINSNLTDGSGISLTAPIFIEFSFINNIQTINGITLYSTESQIATSLPQTPEFESLGLKIQNSSQGDYYEIFGVYNDTIAEFKKFIDDSIYQGRRYYVQYSITMYEQNIRGKTTTFTLTDSFNEPIEFRPIIKYSTTTAVIDVEMKLIDAVDDSYIIRRASYGMLQDEVSKYSLRLMKINLANAAKPKIYNIKSSINPDVVGVANSFGIIPVNNNPKQKLNPNITLNSLIDPSNSNVVVEQVKVPFPVLIDRFNVMAKSDSAVFGGKTFFGFGKMQILLYPFDNIVGFTIASGSTTKPNYMDLSSYRELKLTFKNDSNSVSFGPYTETGEIDLTSGIITFRINQAKMSEIKRIYNSGINVFYITGTNNSVTTVIYTGLFKIYDNSNNVAQLNQSSLSKPDIILDSSPIKGTAIVKPSTGVLGNQPLKKPNVSPQLPNIQSDVIQKLGDAIFKRI